MPGRTERRRSATRRRGLLRWTFVVAWVAVILVYSSRSEDSLPWFFVEGKYAIHFIEYLVLALLFEYALNVPWRRGWLTSTLAMSFTALFGVIDEMAQALALGRVPQVFDWIIDSSGAVLGSLVGAWLLSCVWLFSMHHQRWKKNRQRAIENNETFDTY